MKTIEIETLVDSSLQNVYAGFTLELFEALKPPLMGLSVDRFDGSNKGNEIHLKLGLPGPGFLRPVRWISVITEEFQSEEECYFIDEGTKLPPPLSYWKHKHRMIKKSKDETLIRDEIKFETAPAILESSIYPLLKFQFQLRRPVYREYFGVKK